MPSFIPRSLARLAIIGLLGTAFLALLILSKEIASGQEDTTSVEVRITALRLSDGRTEFALQRRETNGVWGERLLPRGRYFPAHVGVGRWLNSTPLTLGGEDDSVMARADQAPALVRITARLVDDGRIEFALQQRQPGGQWGERQLPRSRMFPADARVDRWLSSSALTVSAGRNVREPVPPVDTACRFTDHADRVSTATFQVQLEASSGTAFYIGQDEWITNHHVVDGVSQVLLVRADYSITATVVGSLPDYDLALLRAPAPFSVEPLQLAELQHSQGSNVSVFGFPPGVSGTPSLTRGAISKHAPFTQFSGFSGQGLMVQIDAALNPGNSGGPMVNDCGVVVGIATLKFFTTSDGRALEGIGFGVASGTVVAQLPTLRATGHVSTPAVEANLPQLGVESRGSYDLGAWYHEQTSERWITVVSMDASTDDLVYDKGSLALACHHDTNTLIVTVIAYRSTNFDLVTLSSHKDTIGAFFDGSDLVGDAFRWSSFDSYSRVIGSPATEFTQRAVGESSVGFLLPRVVRDIFVTFDLIGAFETPVQHLLEHCLTD